jgi:hypothetical protein
MADVRILLTDKAIARLPTPKEGWYLARDTELKGFFVVVGKRKKTFTVQGDLRQAGKRSSSIRLATPARYRHALHAPPPRIVWLKSAEDSIRKPKSVARESMKPQPSTLTRRRLRAESRLDKPGSVTETPT